MTRPEKYILIYFTVFNFFCSNLLFQEVSKLYGEYLSEKGRYQEAGLVLSRVGQLELALSAFESCLDWNMTMITATQLDVSSQRIQLLARQLASKIISVDYLTVKAVEIEVA